MALGTGGLWISLFTQERILSLSCLKDVKLNKLFLFRQKCSKDTSYFIDSSLPAFVYIIWSEREQQLKRENG